ncbi:hypothetical protein ACQP1O_20805 [Nocardia sp. CA-151230]|uniref:hypothetical protein n=1 Tax=Nocardia sp. CA-151230 TaxID=3239982 RepID=UPI003D8FFF9D
MAGPDAGSPAAAHDTSLDPGLVIDAETVNRRDIADQDKKPPEQTTGARSRS